MMAATGTGPSPRKGRPGATLQRAQQEDDLVARARRGDREALTALVDRCRGAIVAAVVTVKPPQNIGLAEATHLARRQILERFATGYRGEGMPCEWMAIVARNRTRDLLRDEGRSLSRPVSIDLTGDQVAVDAAPGTARADNWDTVHRILAELPAEDVEILTLHFLHGLTGSELAERLGCSDEGIRNRVRDACTRAHATAAALQERTP